MSRNPCDGCDGCSPDGFLEMLAKLNSPDGFLEPGQKISSSDASLMRKGGLKAFFNSGVNPLDLFYGRFAKNLLIVDGEKAVRQGIIRGLEDTVFETFAASNFDNALNVLGRIGQFSYVLLGDYLNGEAADVLFDRVVEHSPDAKVFAYTGSKELVRPYRQVLLKGDVDVRGVCSALISDAETPEFYKILIGDDNIEKLRARFNFDRVLKGKRVDYASAPEAVIEMSKKKKYDIIVTDLQYTQDGSEGFDVLRSVEAPVKVLWTAAADAPGVKETAKDCGANRVFHKYDTRQMLDFLRRGLE